MRALRQRCFAWAIGIFLWVAMVTPAFLSYRFAALVAWILTPFFVWKGKRTRPERTSLRRNFQIAYGSQISEAFIRDMTGRVLRHLAYLVIDFARLPLFGEEALAETVPDEVVTTLRELQAEGKGVIGVGGHVGVFGLLGHIAGALGLPTHTISRPNKNPYLQNILRRRQQATGQINIDNKQIARVLTNTLKEGNLVGVLLDEAARRSDLSLPFLGTLATVNTAFARFHLRLGSPIVVLNVHRTRPGHYRMTIQGIVREERGSDRKAAARRVMEQVTKLIEEAIRMQPEQWFWNSKRWKYRPPGEVLAEDGLPPRVEAPILPAFYR